MKGGTGRENRRSLSAQQADAGQVAHGALGAVVCANLPLYLACGEAVRVFVEDEAQNGSLSSRVWVTLVEHGSSGSFAGRGAVSAAPPPFSFRRNLNYPMLNGKRFANRFVKPS
ncbi:MAG TPA: hypothetical protein VGO36_04220 [Solirubrobacterales bacterium]|nr:hypothetical protein [Solirubrobacterales bacterium]